jgi:hypothetical protein
MIPSEHLYTQPCTNCGKNASKWVRDPDFPEDDCSCIIYPIQLWLLNRFLKRRTRLSLPQGNPAGNFYNALLLREVTEGETAFHHMYNHVYSCAKTHPRLNALVLPTRPDPLQALLLAYYHTKDVSTPPPSAVRANDIPSYILPIYTRPLSLTTTLDCFRAPTLMLSSHQSPPPQYPSPRYC